MSVLAEHYSTKVQHENGRMWSPVQEWWLGLEPGRHATECGEKQD